MRNFADNLADFRKLPRDFKGFHSLVPAIEINFTFDF